MGNIHSVNNAIKEIGFDPTVSNKGEDVDKSDFLYYQVLAYSKRL